MDALASLHHVPAAWLRNSALAPFVPAYWRWLIEQHYAAGTARQYMCGVAHFARWMHRRRLALCDLTEDVVQRFVDEHLPRCTCPSPVQRCRHQVRAALRHLLAQLKDGGALAQSHAPNAVEDELRRFDEYMQHARGLAENTRLQRLHIVRPFLQQTCGSSPQELTSPTSGDLRRFIAAQLQRWSPASAGVLAGALRGYVRFRAACGDDVAHLLPIITSPANWPLAPLPQTLSRIEVTQLLEAFPPDLPSAQRAYAMVRCVVDLGLRASEVVRLGLDDIDWPAGTLRIVKNKSRRVDVLPLPPATGRAIAKYLRDERPKQTANRRVFVRHVAPVDKPIGPGVVRRAVREAYLRCGLPHTRVHVLRHSLASRLLDTGGTLKEVADVLRHRELDTSLIYAKVDMARLSAVAMPWPGSAA
jgi:site-specific recombinase XerD